MGEEKREEGPHTWVTVERSAETFLVKMVSNETNASAENEEAVENTDLKVRQ